MTHAWRFGDKEKDMLQMLGLQIMFCPNYDFRLSLDVTVLLF
jgi:hypothetical protein